MSDLEHKLREHTRLLEDAAKWHRTISLEVEQTYRKLAELEESLHQKQVRLTELEAGKEKIILDYLLQNSKELAERSKVFYALSKEQASLFDPEQVQKDRRLIQVYEENQDVPEIAQSVEPKYREAKLREENRQSYKKALNQELTATVIWKELPEGRAEIYLPVTFANGEESGEPSLASNLAEVVAEVILDPSVQFEGPENYHGLQKILLSTATSENSNSALSKLLRKQPLDFAPAKVKYEVLVVPGEINATEKKEVSIGRTGSMRDGAEEYVPVRETRAYTGLSYLTLYPLFDLNGGPIKTALSGRKRVVNVSSLVDFVEKKYGPIKWYTIKEAAEEWGRRVKQEFGDEQRDTESYCSDLRHRISQRGIIARKEEGKLLLCERELQSFLVSYLAQKKLERWAGAVIPRGEFVKILPMEYQNPTILARQGKLVLTPGYQAITLESARTFLKEHHYNGQIWAAMHFTK